jgi:hypothetical protein
MKTWEKKITLFFKLVISLLLFMSFNAYGQVIRMSVEDLARESKTILVGQCTKVESAWDENHDRIYTEVRVMAEDYLKGNEGQELTITVPGGRVGNIIYEVSDMPAFAPGDQFVAFITKHPSGKNLVTGALQGKLTIREDPQTGHRTVLRPPSEPASQNKSFQIFDESERRTEKVRLDDFIKEVKGYIDQ